MKDDLNIFVAGLVVGLCGIASAAWLGLMWRIFSITAGLE